MNETPTTSTTQCHYQVARAHETAHDHTVRVTPTLRTANDWARALLGELSKDVALAARLTSTAAGIADGHTTGAAREATIARLQVALIRSCRTDLSTDEADVFADDIHDAMVTLPPCEAEDCTTPEFQLGLCWDHWNARRAVVDARTAKSVTA